MLIGNKEFDIKDHTYIMGILNVTPDSFSDGGKWNSFDKALFHTEEMINEGADIIDIGGESTRPGHIGVLPAQEELQRIMPILESVNERFDIPISVDTYKSSVAEEAVKAGAALINDIWGCRYDSHMADVIARGDVCCCLMHNREEPVYENFPEDVKTDLSESIRLVKDAGVKDDKIIIDPGIGFGKKYEDNLILLKDLGILHDLGYPILLGTSRKSVIGLTLDLPPDERLEGTIATTVLGVMKGCAFVRVHDVKENLRAVKMTEAIMKAE